MVNWKDKRLEYLLLMLVAFAAVVFTNLLVDRFPLRIDLTEEKRFSINDASIDLLRNLDDAVYVEIYLEGELPSGFKRFQNSIRELLDQFSYYGGINFQYRFVNPETAQSARGKNEFYKYLTDKGIQPTNLSYKQSGGRAEKLIFPGAVVSYYGQEKGVMLLKGNRGAPPEEIINQSIENLEFEFISAIRKLSDDRKKRIGIIQGHGELDSLQVAGFTSLLLEKYDVFQINLPTRTRPLEDYEAIVIAKPTKPFSEKEKLLIDQYIMNGGSMLMFLDPLGVNMDSASGEGTYALPYETNLNDLLFRYGLRINSNFIQDINCGFFPVVAGNMGDQAQIRMLPWPFFPLINAYGDHPIVRNLDASVMKFASTMDTVKAVGVQKTPLMLTSPYTRVLGAPVRVSFNDLQRDLNPDRYQSGPQAVGYLLEGKFTSLYKNRILPDPSLTNFTPEAIASGKIVVVSDGDFIRNDFDKNQPQDLGYDPMQKVMYANKDFVGNAMDYLTDASGIINTRLKEVTIRPLDKVKVAQDRFYWQVLNLAGPLVIIIVFGVLRGYYRKRKFTRMEQ